MNKGRVLGYCLGWTKSKLHNLKISALSNSGFHRNLEHDVAASRSLVTKRTYSHSAVIHDHDDRDPEQVLYDAPVALSYLDRDDVAEPNMALATCLQLLGSVSLRLQQFDDSLGYLNRASEVLKQLEEEGNDITPILHAIHSDTFIGKKEKAIMNARKVLETYCEESILGNANRDAAEAYLCAFHYKDARYLCLKALEMHSKDPLEMARDRRLLAVIEFGYKLDRIYDMLDLEGWVSDTKHASVSTLGDANRDVAEAYLGALNFKEARHYCLKALELHSMDPLEEMHSMDPLETARDRRLLAVIESGYEIDRNGEMVELEGWVSGIRLDIKRTSENIVSDPEKCSEELRNILKRTSKDSEEMIYAMVFVFVAMTVVRSECRQMWIWHDDEPRSWPGEPSRWRGEPGEPSRWLAMAMDILSKNQVSWPLAVADAYVEISVAYEAMDDFGAATSVMKEARRIAANFPDEELLVIDMDVRIGWLLLVEREYEDAVVCLEKTLQRMEDSDKRLFYAYNSLGAAYMEMRMMPSAASALRHAKHCFKSQYPVESIRNLAKAYAAMGDYERAIMFQEKVVQALGIQYKTVKGEDEDEDEDDEDPYKDSDEDEDPAEVELRLWASGKLDAKVNKEKLERSKLELEQLKRKSLSAFHPPQIIAFRPPVSLYDCNLQFVKPGYFSVT